MSSSTYLLEEWKVTAALTALVLCTSWIDVYLSDESEREPF